MNDNFDTILKWYSGKGLTNAQMALGLVRESVAQGYWVKGASRKVMATLDKANVAKKAGKANEDVLGNLGVKPGESRYDADKVAAQAGWRLSHSMYFGQFHYVQGVDFAALEAAAVTAAEKSAIALGKAYAQDFAEISKAIKTLDATRPQPRFLADGEVSPTVRRTLDGMDAVKAEVCPIEWKLVERTDEEGRVYMTWVGKLLWPADTRHNRSRFANGGCNCEACGHRIKNPYNWVPFILTTRDGAHKSLWVGRDCAERLFGVKMDGDLEIEGE